MQLADAFALFWINKTFELFRNETVLLELKTKKFATYKYVAGLLYNLWNKQTMNERSYQF